MAQHADARAADPGAADWSVGDADDAAFIAEKRQPAQVLDDLGHVEGAPRLARPSWHRLASAERWSEPAP